MNGRWGNTATYARLLAPPLPKMSILLDVDLTTTYADRPKLGVSRSVTLPEIRARPTVTLSRDFRALQLLINGRMETEGNVATSPDITFTCARCKSPLVVKAAAAGLSLNCKHCGKLTGVPKPSTKAAPSPEKLGDIQNRLKENESQRTEITGYINQSQIQLHRWQLRLQSLNERKAELEEELRKIS